VSASRLTRVAARASAMSAERFSIPNTLSTATGLPIHAKAPVLWPTRRYGETEDAAVEQRLVQDQTQAPSRQTRFVAPQRSSRRPSQKRAANRSASAPAIGPAGGRPGHCDRGPNDHAACRFPSHSAIGRENTDRVAANSRSDSHRKPSSEPRSEPPGNHPGNGLLGGFAKSSPG